MKKFLIILAALLSVSPLSFAKETTYRARITYYSSDAKWGNQVASPNTSRAKSGVTVAAHPNFSFGTKIKIPALKGVVGDSNFIVQDRGTAVTSKKASGGKAYVFDVYVSSHAEVWRLASRKPMYMDVIVYD